MRSSIACIRCRRSKVKCVNNGVGTTCRSCEHAGRECTYPSPVAGSVSRQRDSISARSDGYAGGGGGGGGGGDAERRQRARKAIQPYFNANSATGIHAGLRPALDALDSRILTPHVWEELFDIFQIHYSADLPFLHRPSFLKPLRHATSQSSLQGSPSYAVAGTPPASTEFLLAFLALTARFHPKLVAHHSPSTSSRGSNPLIASEFYAAAASARLANGWITDHRSCDIQRTQSMLMLGLHDWGMCRGARAWLTIGTAIRSAQVMGLQYELDLDDQPLSRSLALDGDAPKSRQDPARGSSNLEETASDVFIQQEVRRRTFWSCYIMDRYLSSGKYRPQMLHASELRIQLPASEQSFLFAEKVRTLMLGEDDESVSGMGRAEVVNQRQQSVLLGTLGTLEPSVTHPPAAAALKVMDEEKGRLEKGANEGSLSRYIKILEIYGRVIKWSCCGGRRLEEHPPWDFRSDFYKLLRQCNDFKASLPRQHTLTPQNTHAHISLKTLTPYILLHTVYLLCQIILHREYVPFVPIRCSKPEGPLDSPTFPPDKFAVPDGFWEKSARDCFRSAREIMNLVQTCDEWRSLVETPIVGFAVYTVAFVGAYCHSFPWMDPDGFMCAAPHSSPTINGEKPDQSKGGEAALKSLEMIGNMRSKLKMADGWFKTINHMRRYFHRIKSDYKKNIQTVVGRSSDGGSPVNTRHLSLREGGLGGGLDEYEARYERVLKEFGDLTDQDVEMTDDSIEGATVRSEEAGERLEHATSAPDPQKQDGGAWSAINTGLGASVTRLPSMSTPSSAQFRSYDSFSSQTPQPQPPQSHPPPHTHLPPLHRHTPSITSFRPAPSEKSGSAGVPPSLTSTGTHSTAASTPSQSQPSPPFDRQHGYAGWTSRGSVAYAAPTPQPPPNSYSSVNATNGTAQHQQHHNHAPSSTHDASSPAAYPASNQPTRTQQQPQPYAPMEDVQQQAWDPAKKEAFLNSIVTRLGGDDVAAFINGEELHEWSTSAAADHGFDKGWLNVIWGMS